MAQIDRLLAAMVSNKADSLVLEDGDLAKVDVQGHLRPLTKSPITSTQIIGLLREIASVDAQKLLDANQPTTVAHVTNDGAFTVSAQCIADKWQIVARIDATAEFQRLTTAPPKANDQPPAPAVPATPVAPPAVAAPPGPAPPTPPPLAPRA
ncbi:MAG: hypothetical protein WEE89_17760, partial [Gemmatimonadota bacterium]